MLFSVDLKFSQLETAVLYYEKKNTEVPEEIESVRALWICLKSVLKVANLKIRTES